MLSTGSEEQLASYEAQVDYYTRYIHSNAEWEFARVYTNEEISALNTKNRDGFKSIIYDVISGKIDLIITKSVRHFAMNTVDRLSTIRRLKENVVEVYSIWSHLTAKVSFSWRLCPLLRRRKAAPFQIMSLGNKENASLTARSAWHTDSFSATAKAMTESLRLCRKK